MATAGARVKIRTGGTAAEAIPSTQALAQMLSEIAARRLIFKATAGLHHPLRGRHALTYADGSPTAVMHGFVNLASAAALLYFGGDAKRSATGARRRMARRMAGHARKPSSGKRTVGAPTNCAKCGNSSSPASARASFEEPMRELEALRWL